MMALLAPSDSFDIPLPLVAGAMPFDSVVVDVAPVLLEEGTPTFGFPASAALPMTGHQRVFQWPIVGPVSDAGSPPRLSDVPQELAQPFAGISLAMVEVLRPFEELADDSFRMAIDTMTELRIPRARINQMGFRNQWTARQDDPIVFQRPAAIGEGSSVRFVISGVTRNGTGAALPNVVVSVFRVDELAYPNDPDVFSDPLIAQVTSDASGNFSIEVRGPGPYQLMGYLAGSPDVAGVTVNTIVPVAA